MASYLAIPRKDGKAEFVPQDPQTLTCVYSLFPQMAIPPAGTCRANAKSASICRLPYWSGILLFMCEIID